MYLTGQHRKSQAFALPTVLIASVVLLIVLVSAVTATATIRTALKNQYYMQLAQVAGEAGVNFAKACLAANNNAPTWSDAKPLMPNTDCNGTVQSSQSPYIMVNNGVASRFSVRFPTTDSSGKAMMIPNNGFVDLLRTSSPNAVWRTYQQPATRPTFTPNFCGGNASSSLGWNNAVTLSYSTPPNPNGAQSIGIITSPAVNPGPIYYEKDFNLRSAGSYVVQVRADDSASVYIDGALLGSTYGYSTISSFSTTLTQGCHTINVNSINGGYVQGGADIALSLASSSTATPVVATDTSWRVTAGAVVPFNAPGYYAHQGSWTNVRDMQPSYTINSSWSSVSGEANPETRWISPGFGYDASGYYPSSQYIALQDTRTITVASPTSVNVSYDCDDSCTILLDGNSIGNGTWNSVKKTPLTLSAGSHTFGIILYNGTGPSGVMMAVVRTSDNTLLTRTEANSWKTTNAYFTSSPTLTSYDMTYQPSPSPTQGIAYGSYLIVAGGGGGARNAAGGGGGGGVVTSAAYQLSVGSTNVVVGVGAVGAPANGTSGGNGGNSSFGSNNAVGGGTGAPRDANLYAGAGGSGGGGAGGYTSPSQAGGAGTAGQGSNGGAGTSPDAGCNSTGGGGGGVGGSGWNAVAGGMAGQGGPGMISWITGIPTIFGAGGGGSTTCAGTNGTSDPTAGSGGSSGTANTGGGGGASGGNGGSGIVVLSFPIGAVTVSGYTGAYTAINFNGNTIYKFTSSGTLTISSINI